MEGDDLSQLMPNTQLAALRTSPGNSEALRDYIRVLGNNQNAGPAQADGPSKPRREGLQLRAGTGRAPERHRFSIRIRPEDLEAHEARLQEEAAAIDPEELREALLMQALAQRSAALQATLRPGTGRTPPRHQFNITLRELAPPSPDENAAASEGAAAPQGTPGTRLLQSTQMGLARTPGTSGLLARYSPMEGVPERLTAPRARAPPGTVLRSGGQASREATPHGYTPMEGIPERLLMRRASAGAGNTRVLSNQGGQAASVSSPVEGLVRQAAGPGGAQTGQAPAGEEFAFAALQGARNASLDDDDHDDGGYDDGGYDDGGYGGDDNPGMADAGMQTGTSLLGEGGSAGAPADGDLGAGANWIGDYGDGLHQEGPEEAAAAPAEVRRPRKHLPTKDPGVRLRNELKRKSLAINPKVGRQEVAPGIRRSMREGGPPLMFWLNETKVYTRVDHKTMPTIRNLVHKIPNTPWRMVSDPFPTRKRRAVAAKPAAPAAAEEEDGETETDEEEVTQRQLAAVMDGAGGEEVMEEAEQQQKQGSPLAAAGPSGAAAAAAGEEGGEGWPDYSDEEEPESAVPALTRHGAAKQDAGKKNKEKPAKKRKGRR